jgi:hypothetical protein
VAVQGSGGNGADMAALADQVPHLAGMLQEIAHDGPGSTLGWCGDQTEFEFAVDLILDGLDRMRGATAQASRRRGRATRI